MGMRPQTVRTTIVDGERGLKAVFTTEGDGFGVDEIDALIHAAQIAKRQLVERERERHKAWIASLSETVDGGFG